MVTTLLTTLLLLVISGQVRDTTAADLMPLTPAPLLLPLTSTPAPTVATATPSPQPTRAGATPSPASEPANSATPDDAELQAAIDKKLGDDASLSQLGITATVSEGKIVLVGTTPSDEMKEKVEKLVRSVKGVKQINNQIVVITQ